MKKLLLIPLFFLAGCDTSQVHGTVIGKAYSPSATGVGPVIGGKGGVVITNTPEKYVLILKYDDGTVDSEEVGAERWADLEKGDHFTAVMHWYGPTGIKKENQ